MARACVGLGRPHTIVHRSIKRTEVSAEIDGILYRAGNASSYPDVPIPPELRDATLVFFGEAERCLLIVALQDPVRTESGRLIEQIKQLSLRPSIFRAIVRRWSIASHIH